MAINNFYVTGIKVDFTLKGNLLTCSTNTSLIVDSIELLDINGQRIFGPVVQTSLLVISVSSHSSNTYICRVNSTLGSQSTVLDLAPVSTTDGNDDITTYSIIGADLLLQLRLFEVRNCLEWVVSYFIVDA